MPYLPDVSSHTTLAPNGAIYVYEDVPFDSDYTHSLNRAVQGNADLQSVISGYLKHTLTAQSYSRLTENSVRIQRSKEELKHCNYIAITNGAYYVAGETNALTSNENFVYYAFITDVEYVNNVVSDVYFEIDYLQTYWHCFTIPANFIEREHCLISDDVVGKNLYPESLELGEYLVNNYYHKNYYDINSAYFVILYIPNLNTTSNAYVYYDTGTNTCERGTAHADQFKPGMRCGFGDVPACLSFPVANNNECFNQAIAKLIDANASILSAFIVSGEMYSDNFNQTTFNNHTITFNESQTFKRTDGTTYSNVRNKKLLNYPFKSLVVSNNNGQTCDLKWELFSGRENGVVVATFYNTNAMIPNPVATVAPKFYRQMGIDYDNTVVITDFPQMNWSEDSYSKWWAQNQSNLGLSLTSTAISTGFMILGKGAGVATGGIGTEIGASALQGMVNARLAGDPKSAGRFKSLASQAFEQESAGGSRSEGFGRMKRMALGYGAQNIAKTLGQIQVAKDTPDTAKIQTNMANLNGLQGRMGFTFYDMGISGEMAEIIDKYFDMFGYATNKVKLPNFLANPRSIWDYIKMDNCFIKAQTGQRGLPENAQKAIQAIFNNGITLWGNVAQIGNYNLDNHSQHS